MRLFDHIRDRLHQRAGIVSVEAPMKGRTFEQLRRSEWSHEFEHLMRNRMVMGALRYGLLSEKKKGHKRWDLLGALKKKAEMYEKTGNTEYLVDAANYCMLAFEYDDHPLKHFEALDDHSDHCRLK